MERTDYGEIAKQIDASMQKYAEHLQDIYDNRTAGDHTFVGVLSTFLSEAGGLIAEGMRNDFHNHYTDDPAYLAVETATREKGTDPTQGGA